MKIGIFVVMAGRRAGGPEVYEVELIRALAALDRHNEYIIYCTGEHAVKAIGVTQENFQYRVLWPSIRALSIPFALPMLLKKDGVDFYHATFTPTPVAASPLIFTMHCVSSLVHPEFYRPAVAWRLNRLLKIGMKKARTVICVSRTTGEHIRESYGVDSQRIHLAYNGVSRIFSPVEAAEARRRVEEQLRIAEPYILYVGKHQAHKNLVRLVEAFDLFRKESGSKAKLVLVGRPQGNSVGVDEKIRELRLESEVIRPGFVDTEALPSLYSAARMFVFPSLWEGFGIPLVEAMACGAPVVTSNVTCLPETAGDAAVIVNPYSAEAIAEGMLRIDSSAALRQSLIKRGFERARFFTWENCARSTMRAYSSAHAS